MSRFTDFRVLEPVNTASSVLPPVAWASIGAQAPAPMTVNYEGPDAPLPAADVVMFTWTDSEWSAMDHVFLHSSTQGANQSTELIHKWLQYSKSAPSGSGEGGQLWGYYQLVDVQGGSGAKRVLLLKSDSHLAHPPWITGLQDMVKAVVADAKPQQIYSIGTAGGASVNQNLGDVAITNGGKLDLQLEENTPSGLSGKTYTSSWFPNLSLMPKAQQLFFPLNKIVTQANLASVLEKAKKSKEDGAQQLEPFSLNDLLNAPLDPANLGSPKAVSFHSSPLLTTDFYFIAAGNTDYAALEMDDAVIGYAATQANVDFVFVRNISDTLVPAKTPSNQPIPADARQAWSSAVYNAFGMFTSLNSAIAAWATIAAM
jgi:nucleoside phosphorylase